MQLDSLQQSTQFSISPRLGAATPLKASSLARNALAGPDRLFVPERSSCWLQSIDRRTSSMTRRARGCQPPSMRLQDRHASGWRARSQVLDPPAVSAHDRVANLREGHRLVDGVVKRMATG